MKLESLRAVEGPILVSSSLMLSIVKSRRKSSDWTVGLVASSDAEALMKMGNLMDVAFRDERDVALFQFSRGRSPDIVVVTVRSPGLSADRVEAACGQQPRFCGGGARRRLIVAKAASDINYFSQFLMELEGAEDLN